VSHESLRGASVDPSLLQNRHMKLSIAAVVAVAAIAAAPASSSDIESGCVAGEIPVAYLVPQGAYPRDVWVVPAGGGVPRQVVVEWGKKPDKQGIGIWQCGPPTRLPAVWHRLYSRLWPTGFYLEVHTGDVTLDGHPEVLLELSVGTGIHGPRVLLDTSRGRARPIFHRTTHDTTFEIWSHALVVQAGVYTWHDSHCCPTFYRRTIWRWKGNRLRPVTSGLYAQTGPRATGPLHFVPTSAVSWDDRRGVAVSGAHPWLLGRTSDGGKTWRIVDASPVPLVGLTSMGAGTAIARFAGSPRIAATADYGASWSPQYGWPLIQVGPG
jgi:hypothetical protein